MGVKWMENLILHDGIDHKKLGWIKTLDKDYIKLIWKKRFNDNNLYFNYKNFVI